MGDQQEQKPVLRLASASPRRRQLLEVIGVPHVVTPAHIDETPEAAETPGIYVTRLAKEKATQVRERHKDLPVLAADTTVCIDGLILEKPRDEADCIRMLSLLSGRPHDVYTGVAIISEAFPTVGCALTKVHFRRISQAEMRAYWASGEPQGKAGGYAIQGLAAVFVEKIVGSYTNVMGLPIYETAESLRNHGIPMWNGTLTKKEWE